MKGCTLPAVVMMLTALFVVPARAEIRELGTSAKGIVVWFGNVIEPPLMQDVSALRAGRVSGGSLKIIKDPYMQAYVRRPEPMRPRGD